MKKNYFMLAAATMLFAACAETDVLVDVSEKESAPQEISFDAFANKATRAEITDLSDLQENTVGFQVWGYKYPSTDQNVVWNDVKEGDVITTAKNYFTVFDGVDVTYANSAWGYGNDKQYWDKTSKYNFYAVAPKEGSYSITDGKIKITNIASAKSDESADYLIDRDGATLIDGGATTKSPVAFQFNHIMAKLSFVLQAGVSEDIRVTSLTMTGWNGNTGIFTQDLTTTPSVADDVTEWGFTNDTSRPGTITLVGDNATDATLVLPNTKQAKNVSDKYIMVPQSIAANTLTFTITYSIGLETFTAQVGQVKEAQVWGTDSHTTYTITVGPEEISFNTTHTVGGWTHSDTGSTAIQ